MSRTKGAHAQGPPSRGSETATPQQKNKHTSRRIASQIHPGRAPHLLARFSVHGVFHLAERALAERLPDLVLADALHHF